MADREPFPPVPRMPSYPASGLLGLGLIGAMFAAAVAWGWWTVPLVFIAFIMLIVVLRELRLWLGWKWHRRSRDPALADVNSWLYRDDADHLVGELVTNEKMLIALPARDIESGDAGVLAATSLRLLFRPTKVPKHAYTVSVRFQRITGAVVGGPDGRPPEIHLGTDHEQYAFRISAPAVRAWDFLGQILAHLDGRDQEAQLPEAIAEPVADFTDERDVRRTYLMISPPALTQLRGRGGSLFLWLEALGRESTVDKMGTKPPRDNVDFIAIEDESVTVNLDARVPRPHNISVEWGGLIWRRFTVTLDGQRWGRRGFWLE